MKYLILLGDGMADWPVPDLGGRTPLDVARSKLEAVAIATREGVVEDPWA